MPYMYSEMQNKLSKTRESPLESMGQIISSRCPFASMISEVPDWWLRQGKQKFTVDLNGSIANHWKAIWPYVLRRSAERSKVS